MPGSQYHGFVSCRYIPVASHLLTLPFQLLALILTILNCLFTLYGTGRHITVQEPQWVTPSLKVSYCVRLIYVLVLGTTKIAVLTLYRRVFDDKKTRNIIWSMMGAVALYTTPVLLMYLFQCRPIYGVWESSIQKTCINTDTVVYIAAGCSIALDIALVIVAVPRIRKSYFACQIISHSTHQEHNQLAIAYPKEQLTANNLYSPAQTPPNPKSRPHRHRLPQHPRHYQRRNPPRACDRPGIQHRLYLYVFLLISLRSYPAFPFHSQLPTLKLISGDDYDVTTWTAVEVNVGLFCAAAPAIRPLIRAVTGAFDSSPSSDRNYPRHGMYGTGTGSRAIELNDSEGFNAARPKNMFWTNIKTELSDGESTKGVLDQGQEGADSGIMRTVVISVNRESERIDTDSERDDDEREGERRKERE
jgi:hypothetical protein